MSTPTQRSLAAKIAIHVRWANESDPVAATAKARRAFMARFEREVDPDGVLPEEERNRRAYHAMSAHMQRMALARENKRREKRLAAKKTPGAPHQVRPGGVSPSKQRAAAS